MLGRRRFAAVADSAARRTMPGLGLAVLALTIAIAALAVGMPGTAHADGSRFGPPWLGIVAVEEGGIAYARPSLDAPQQGFWSAGTRIPVLSEVQGDPGPDGDTTWYGTKFGYFPSAVLRDDRDPWIAEVLPNAVDLFAYPNAKGPVRQTAKRGSLLRVTGVAPGLEGDRSIWWATTEGFVALDALRPADTDFARAWQMPDPSEAAQGWWGRLTTDARVRAAATTDAPIVGRLSAGQPVKVLSEEQGQRVDASTTWYRIDGGRYAGGRIHSSLVRKAAQPKPNATPPKAMPADRTWITVDRKASTLTFVQNGQPIFVTYVSLGKAGRETPSGEFAILAKYRTDDMTSASIKDATHPYYLPNVPTTEYFLPTGQAIHGTYWHDAYGDPQSQGCVNVTVTDGAYLFGLTKPGVPAGTNSAEPGRGGATPLVIVG